MAGGRRVMAGPGLALVGVFIRNPSDWSSGSGSGPPLQMEMYHKHKRSKPTHKCSQQHETRVLCQFGLIPNWGSNFFLLLPFFTSMISFTGLLRTSVLSMKAFAAYLIPMILTADDTSTAPQTSATFYTVALSSICNSESIKQIRTQLESCVSDKSCSACTICPKAQNLVQHTHFGFWSWKKDMKGLSGPCRKGRNLAIRRRGFRMV